MSITKQKSAQKPVTTDAPASPEGEDPSGVIAGGTASDLIRAGDRCFTDQKYPEALAKYELALKKSPDDIGAMTKAANSLYKIRDFPAAIEYFKKILEKDPKNKDVIYTMGMVYVKAKDKVNALATYDRLKKLHQEKAEALYKAIYT